MFEVSITVGFRPPYSHVQVPLNFILSHDDGGVCHAIDIQLWVNDLSKVEQRLQPDQVALMEKLQNMASLGNEESFQRNDSTPRLQTKGTSPRIPFPGKPMSRAKIAQDTTSHGATELQHTLPGEKSKRFPLEKKSKATGFSSMKKSKATGFSSMKKSKATGFSSMRKKQSGAVTSEKE